MDCNTVLTPENHERFNPSGNGLLFDINDDGSYIHKEVLPLLYSCCETPGPNAIF